jgi:hypothetical protein
LPPLQTVDLTGVECLRVGRWNERVYTLTDLDNMVEAFHALKGQYDPPVKLGHNDGQAVAENDGVRTPSDDEPAFGWVSNLYRRGNVLLADLTKVPRRFADLVRAGAWPKRSSEVWFATEFGNRKFPAVFKALSFLGGAPPAVSGLADVEAYYSHSQAPTVATLSDAADATATVEYLAGAQPAVSAQLKYSVPGMDYQGGAAPPDNIMALPAKKRRQWCEVWNSAYDAAKADGKSDADAEAAAFKQANGVVLSATRLASEAPMPRPRARPHADLAATAAPGYKQLQQVLQDALDAAYPPADPEQAAPDASQDGPSNTLVEFNDESVFVTDLDGDAFWRIPYTVSADGSAQLGTPVPQVLTDAPAGTNPDQEPDEDDLPEGQEPGEQQAAMARLAAGGAAAAPPDPEKARTKLLAAIDDWLTSATALTAGQKGAPALRVLAKELRAKLAALKLPALQQQAPAQANNSRQEDDEMALRDELRRTLRLAESATDEDILQAVTNSQAGRVDLAEYQQLAQEVQQLTRDKQEREAQALVKLALEGGQIRNTDTMRAWALEEAMERPDRFRKYLETVPKHSLMKLGEARGSDADIPDEATVEQEAAVTAGSQRLGMSAEEYRRLNRPLPELLAERQRQAQAAGSR